MNGEREGQPGKRITLPLIRDKESPSIRDIERPAARESDTEETEPSVVLLDRDYTIRVGLAAGKDKVQLVPSSSCRITAGGNNLDVDADSSLVFEPVDTTPATFVYHVIVETVRNADLEAAAPAVDRWRGRGYEVELLRRGSLLRANNDVELDGRSVLVSAAQYSVETRARAMANSIKQKGWNCWVADELVRPSAGTVRLTVHEDGREKASAAYDIDPPMFIESTGPVKVRNVDFGFWSSKVQDCNFIGVLRIDVHRSGKLELVEKLSMEQYLRGVVPAEMPSKWPAAALEAQAVCARSETLSRLGVRHMGDSFDLCATEHCQAYRGSSWHTEATDSAVAATTGVVLMTNSRLLEAVYSHNCGGHTEDNDMVWASPAEEGLRGVPDAPNRALPGGSLANDRHLRSWLSKSTVAYCSHIKPDEKTNHRWRVRHTAAEIDKMVAEQYAEAGRVRDVRVEERGVSGRIHTLEIVGDRDSVLVHKELPIRRLFGGLYSAMFVLDIDRDPRGNPTSFEFIGGGRGHGVGMCQDGARYLASTGWTYDSILRHYYGKASIVHLYK